MPGILPMKVIKVGSSAQSRIAQACDRCRSKKIRCDGVTPCCSQCLNVGFECKTSDKLSRRAFPRGYTESLEQRVRDLETEVKELKDILDEKDEKIDILSRIHSSSSSSRQPSSETSSANDKDEKDLAGQECLLEDTFSVQQSPCLLDSENSGSYFMGGSSGRAFVDTFKAKVQESGKPCNDFKTESFFASGKTPASSPKWLCNGKKTKAPPCLEADELVNIFFQEWAPLFPVLHRPTFLSLYSDYMANPAGMDDNHAFAQLNLVFGIATLSKEAWLSRLKPAIRFSAALLGLPKLLNEDDIHTEYPIDIDDENVSERGFQPTLPGESTRLSSALALFRGGRILAKVLEELYPGSHSHDLSLQKISALNDELDDWHNSLPAHLRLQFVQDKPSASVISDRSPFLSITYEYIRTLIHRPAVGSSLGSKASSSVVTLGSSSKHIIHTIQLLTERRMHFAFCINKNDLLLLCGFGLLFQCLDLDSMGKLMQDSQRLIRSVITLLKGNQAIGAADFNKLACALTNLDFTQTEGFRENNSRSISEGVVQANSKCNRKQTDAPAAPLSPCDGYNIKKERNSEHRATKLTTDAINPPYTLNKGQNCSSPMAADGTDSFACGNNESILKPPDSMVLTDTLNLDFLSFGNDAGPIREYPNAGTVNCMKEGDGEAIPSFVSGDQLQAPFDHLFPPSEIIDSYINSPPSSSNYEWGPEPWIMSAEMTGKAGPAGSVESFSEGETTSGEEFSVGDLGNEYGRTGVANVDGFSNFEGLEAVFGL
ncbi:MAG: hypothetical protein Q9167_004354 [Letrouitia subvulpina]